MSTRKVSIVDSVTKLMHTYMIKKNLLPAAGKDTESQEEAISGTTYFMILTMAPSVTDAQSIQGGGW